MASFLSDGNSDLIAPGAPVGDDKRKVAKPVRRITVIRYAGR
jgi:hypothetical protein